MIYEGQAGVVTKIRYCKKKNCCGEREIKRELRERGERDSADCNLGQAGGTLGLQRTTTAEQAGL